MLNRDLHRKKMFEILKDIFTSDLGKYLAFKGGTAVYFFHGLDRFSTDLDFDLIKNIDNLDDEIIEILEKHGKVKKGNKLILSYGEEETNIKIDINRNIWENNSYEINNFYGTDIKTQDKSTIFANKLVALTERNANRDIYDIYFFIKNNFEINEKILFERTGKGKKEIFEKIVKKLESLGENYKILDGLGDILKDEKHKNFVKTKLISELVGILKFQIDFN